MARPEWDLALICEEAGITPEIIGNLFCERDDAKLRNIRSCYSSKVKDFWGSIIAAAEAAGAISEIPDSTKPPEERNWKISPDTLNTLLHDVGIIFDVLPEAKKRFISNSSFRIAATIPERMNDLQEFFKTFESTVFGIRRMINQASSEVTILVPFVDTTGLSEIYFSLEIALKKGVKISFITRELAAGGRNMTVLSKLINTVKQNGGDLRLFEALLPDDSPVFHAKVFSRDGGNEIYIGSANLTATSMEKTIEIGVFLKGDETRQVDRFLSIVKSLSCQRWP